MFVPLDGALVCFFWREYIWAVSRRKWGHPYSKHDSQNVWQQSVFSHFLSPLSTVFCGRLLASFRALLQHHPWWFLCKSAKIIWAIPVSVSTSHHAGYLQGICVLIWFVLLFFTLLHHLLCEIRTERSPSSTYLEDSNLSFQGHLHSEPMGTYMSMGFGIWWLSFSLCILLRESSETKTFLTDGKDSLCDCYCAY